MPRRDWPVPARMGFAVNRSQLVQSEWKEMAQKGYFVSATVCEAGGQNKTQSPGLSSHPAGLRRRLRGTFAWDLTGCNVTLLTHDFVDALPCVATLLQPLMLLLM